jgi:peptide-methionine (S)-S-oxide reductase
MRTVLFAIAIALWTAPAIAAESATAIPPPAVDESLRTAPAAETAVLAGGCFWGVQVVFQHVTGVSMAVSGYAGGTKDTAQYETVSSGQTGHAESVEITFDPSVITYGRILQIYFSVAHDPTQLNHQGADTGTQYRSAIFASNDSQRRIAGSYIAQLDHAGVFSDPIVTRIEPLTGFYPAEAYHQDFATLHPHHPYIAFVDLPKLERLKSLLPDVYREVPSLVGPAGVIGRE